MVHRYCALAVLALGLLVSSRLLHAGPTPDASLRAELMEGLAQRDTQLKALSLSYTMTQREGTAALHANAMARATTGPAIVGPLGRTVRYRRDVMTDGVRAFCRSSMADSRGETTSVLWDDGKASWSYSTQPTQATPAIASISVTDPEQVAKALGPALFEAGALVASTNEPWSAFLAGRPFSATSDVCAGEPAVRVGFFPSSATAREDYVWFVPGKGWAVGAVRRPMGDYYQVTSRAEGWAQVDHLWLAAKWVTHHGATPESGLPQEPFLVETAEIGGVDLSPDLDSATVQLDLLKVLPAGSEINDHRLGVSYWLRDPADESRLDDVVRTLRGVLEAGRGLAPSIPDDQWRYRGAAGRDGSRCGPDCLSLLLGFRDVRVAADDLARAAGWTSGGGTTFAGLAEAAAANGISLAGVRLAYRDLVRLGAPAIVPLNYDHFILFIAERNGKVYFVEPPDVIQSMTPAKFAELWTGEALIFKDLLED